MSGMPETRLRIPTPRMLCLYIWCKLRGNWGAWNSREYPYTQGVFRVLYLDGEPWTPRRHLGQILDELSGESNA